MLVHTSVAVPPDMEEHSARKVKAEHICNNLFISAVIYINTGFRIKGKNEKKNIDIKNTADPATLTTFMTSNNVVPKCSQDSCTFIVLDF